MMSVATPTTISLSARAPWYRKRTNQVLIATVLGIALGHYFPSIAIDLKPLPDIFIRLVKMVIGPIVFVTVVCGISQAGDLKKAGAIGLRALIYFEIATTVALALGLLVANVVKPGVGISREILQRGAAAAPLVKPAVGGTTVDALISVFPDNAVNAFAAGNLMQILVFAVLFGIAMSAIRSKVEPVEVLLEQIGKILFAIITFVMRLAPLAALGGMAFAVSRYGAGSLIVLGKLVGTMFLTMTFFVFVVLALVARCNRFSLWRLLKYTKDELLLVLGTSASETVLPSLMKKLEEMGCHRSVVGLVIPTGYSFNQDGAAIYLSMSVLFIAQVYGIDLSIRQQIGILAVLMVTSKGSAGVTGSGFVILAATVNSTNVLPVEGVALLLGVERFLSIGRAMLTVVGNLVAAVVIASSVGELDREVALKQYRVSFDDPALRKI
jgi:aerobic C4-dicarboxylate transport protein